MIDLVALIPLAFLVYLFIRARKLIPYALVRPPKNERSCRDKGYVKRRIHRIAGVEFIYTKNGDFVPLNETEFLRIP